MQRRSSSGVEMDDEDGKPDAVQLLWKECAHLAWIVRLGR